VNLFPLLLLAAMYTVPAYGQNEEGPQDQHGVSLRYLAKGYPDSLESLMVYFGASDECGIPDSELVFALDSELERSRIERSAFSLFRWGG